MMTNHSFVVRIWLEELIGDEEEPKWRGRIMHFPSRQDKYFDDLDVVLVFIQTCLDFDGLDNGEQS